MAARRHLLWLTLPDPLHPLAWYQVYLVMPNVLDPENAAEIIFTRRRIHISAALSVDEIHVKFWHETLHLARGPEPVEDPYDEQFVRGAEKGIMLLAHSLGARLPPFPKGFDKFRERALAAQQ